MENEKENQKNEETFFDIIKKLTSTTVCELFIDHCAACRANKHHELLPAPAAVLCLLSTRFGKQSINCDSIGILRYDGDTSQHRWNFTLTNLVKTPFIRTIYCRHIAALSPDFVKICGNCFINIKFVAHIDGNRCFMSKPFDSIATSFHVSGLFLPFLKQKYREYLQKSHDCYK